MPKIPDLGRSRQGDLEFWPAFLDFMATPYLKIILGPEK